MRWFGPVVELAAKPRHDRADPEFAPLGTTSTQLRQRQPMRPTTAWAHSRQRYRRPWEKQQQSAKVFVSYKKGQAQDRRSNGQKFR